ncbi:MAG: tRNA (adenosine(37)-N6)-threonylcarbamoyltransferase complex ATPase subunit type 1 TsaE [Anaerolineales bacterium]|nr:tRNA (adenosine(37)-N6)-threonylcarbamoyltransferase complex ATPase subunit type 1 TsaE [Anaerolineales bacterium]MDW8226947.1 tRNA (adenosine(37)-N6)-threonylcarbamoyltransferase complex ATPase subunit type 1 TsaE [Anaerolineales bacterium]
MPVLDAHAFVFYSRSPEQTRRLGMRLGAWLKPGDLVCLQGDLGTGKTTFVQGIARGWGALDEVSSPTFVLINLYRRADNSQLAHFDAYRVESPAEAEELDLDGLLSTGPLVVEWPERVEAVLPTERLWVQLEYDGEERRLLRFSGHGKRYQNLLDALRRAVYGGD